jgi:acyl carrier protein
MVYEKQKSIEDQLKAIIADETNCSEWEVTNEKLLRSFVNDQRTLIELSMRIQSTFGISVKNMYENTVDDIISIIKSKK